MKLKVYVIDVKMPRWIRRALVFGAVPVVILGLGALVYAAVSVPTFTDETVLTATPLNQLGQAITDLQGQINALPAVPSGAVMPFDLDACPSGWSDYVAARGRTIVGGNPTGSGNGLTAHNRGNVFGEESHTMTIAEMPSHTHGLVLNGPGSGDNQRFWNLNWSTTSIFGSQAATPPLFGGGVQNF